ncbi:hypothetical protein ACSLPG_37005, partial [Escherichia coli]
AALRDSVPMTLSEDEIARLKGINEDLSLEEVAEIYLPLSRLLFYTHKHVSGGHSSIGKAIFAMARHSSVEWVNGQEGNTRW